MKLRHDLAALLPRLPDGDVPRFCAFYEKYAAHLPAIAGGPHDRLDAAADNGADADGSAVDAAAAAALAA